MMNIKFEQYFEYKILAKKSEQKNLNEKSIQKKRTEQ